MQFLTGQLSSELRPYKAIRRVPRPPQLGLRSHTPYLSPYGRKLKLCTFQNKLLGHCCFSKRQIAHAGVQIASWRAAVFRRK